MSTTQEKIAELELRSQRIDSAGGLEKIE
ncbi:MAG: hypothetical protein PWP65_1169, partial [Clostridia bacterium]|nr:hypothetical protein [Clostridia bacterium]